MYDDKTETLLRCYESRDFILCLEVTTADSQDTNYRYTATNWPNIPGPIRPNFARKILILPFIPTTVTLHTDEESTTDLSEVP